MDLEAVGELKTYGKYLENKLANSTGLVDNSCSSFTDKETTRFCFRSLTYFQKDLDDSNGKYSA